MSSTKTKKSVSPPAEAEAEQQPAPEQVPAPEETVVSLQETPPEASAEAAAKEEAAPVRQAAESFYQQEAARIAAARLRAEAAAMRSAGPLADEPARPQPENEAFTGAFRRQVY